MQKFNTMGQLVLLLALAAPAVSFGQGTEVTFHEDIEPILQRSCQSCHRDGGVGPMPLISYDQVAPFAGLIEYKTYRRETDPARPILKKLFGESYTEGAIGELYAE